MNWTLVGTIAGFLVLLAVGWAVVRMLERAKRLAPPAAAGVGNAADEEPPVCKRDWLLDHRSEAVFYGVLEAAVASVFGAGKCRVMVQMPLCRLVEPETGLSRSKAQTWRNRIDRKTVDYVVCEAVTLRALFAVELDGTSHDREATKKRDVLVQRALGRAGVKLIRVDRRSRESTVAEVAQMVRDCAALSTLR